MSKSPNLEWQFFDDTQQDDAAWQQVCGLPTELPNPTQSGTWRIKRLWKEAVLVLVTSFVLLAQFPWQTIFAAPKPDTPPVSSILTLETAFFRFRYPPQDAHAVQVVAANVDRWYGTLRRQFDLGAPIHPTRLTINVGHLADPAAGPALDLAGCTRQGEILLLCQRRSQPRSSADEFTVMLQRNRAIDQAGPAVQLAGAVQDWLTSRLFDDALHRVTVKPLWQPTVGGIRHYLWLRQNHKQVQLANPALWRVVTTLPLNAAFPDDLRYRAESYPWASAEFQLALNADVWGMVITGSLAEYLVNTYGRERLVWLLHGFSRHESWETLSPAVLGVSARQLEAGWHEYLQHLPPDSPFAAVAAGSGSVEQARFASNAGG